MEYNQLKASIAAVIKTNNRKEITGQLLQNVLFQMTNVIGENLQLAGFATPLTDPHEPDQNLFYITDQGGVYPHFDNLTVDDGLTFLMWKNGEWTSHTVGVVTQEWVDSHYVSIDFFRSLFRAYDSAGLEILPNNNPEEALPTVVDNIKAMVGFWTEQYISALGQQTGGGGGGGATSLDELSDVFLTNPSLGQALVFTITPDHPEGIWVNQTIQAGTDMATVWSALAGNTTQQINISHLTDALADYATKTYVDQNFITVAYFDRLFRAYNGSTLVSHNDVNSTIDNIKAMFGFWTEQYLSALGNNSGGGGQLLALSNMADVTLTTPIADKQVLTFDVASGKWVNGNGGSSSLDTLTDVTLTSLVSGQTLLYDSTTSKWYNSALKTINGQSLLGSGDISVGGGASGNYLPLTGGTLTGNLQIYAESGIWSEGIRMHVAQNGWCALVMAGSDNTGSTGTSARTWNLSNNNGDLYLALNGATTYTYGWSWLMSGDLSFKTSAFTINCSDNALSLNSATANSWIFFKSNGTNKGSVAYYEGMAAIANETNAYRIGVIDNGTPVFRKGGYSGSATYKLLHGGESIELWATGSSFNEGLRMHPSSNSWVGVTLCGVENTGDSGTSANTWCIANHNGQIFINRNDAEGASEYVLCNPNGNWGIATNSPSYKLHVAGTIYATGSITALSDARKKDIMGETGLSVEQIAHAPAVQFLWKDKERRKDGQQVGTLAQYWRTVLPEVVSDKGGELSMQYGVAALVSAIVTARKVVDHERRITELEKENERLRTEVEQLRLN